MVDILDIEDQKKRLEDREQKLRDREISDLAKVMSLVEGRRLVWRILHKFCRLEDSPFSQQTAIKDNLIGRREVGLSLWKELKRLPLDVRYTMEREAINDQLLREVERKKTQGDDDE